MMINEVLFMEVRLLRQFCEEHGLSMASANSLFDAHGIWHYIEECYDVLHMSGDEYILGDIDGILAAKGAVLEAHVV